MISPRSKQNREEDKDVIPGQYTKMLREEEEPAKNDEFRCLV